MKIKTSTKLNINVLDFLKNIVEEIEAKEKMDLVLKNKDEYDFYIRGIIIQYYHRKHQENRIYQKALEENWTQEDVKEAMGEIDDIIPNGFDLVLMGCIIL